MTNLLQWLINEKKEVQIFYSVGVGETSERGILTDFDHENEFVKLVNNKTTFIIPLKNITKFKTTENI